MAAAACADEVWHLSLNSLPTVAPEVEKFIGNTGLTSERGYRFFLEGFVHDFQVCQMKTVEHWQVKARCFHSQKKNESPHNVKINFNGAVVEGTSCTCAVGKAVCHHSIGVLYQLVHYQKLGLKNVPPVLSKTSLPQVWHIPARTKGIEPKPVTSVTIQKSGKGKTTETNSKKRRRVTEGVSSTLYNAVHSPLSNVCIDMAMMPTLKQLESKPQFLQIWTGHRENMPVKATIFGDVPVGSLLSYQLAQQATAVQDDVINIPDFPTRPQFQLPVLSQYFQGPLTNSQLLRYYGMQVTDGQSREYEEITKNQNDSDEWHKLRRDRITASKFKRVCSRKGDYETLVNQLKNAKTIQTKQMKYGIEQEPVAAKHYADICGRNVYKVGLIINPSASYLGCSPDRIVFDPDSQPTCGILEIKCTMSESITQCKYLTVSQGTFKLRKSHDYYFQVMGQLGITGMQWCDFFVKAENDYHLERIMFDEEFFAEMKRKLDAFYFTHFLQ